MSQLKTTNSLFIKLTFILPAIFALAISGQVRANQNQQIAKDSVYTFAEKMPEFQGGEKALVTFLSQHINFPAEAQKRDEHGKVFVQFVVSKTGKVENAKVIKSVSPDLDNEALRVIGLLPDWIPGEQNGEKVAVQRIIPIMFQNAPPKDPNAWEPTEKTLFLIDGSKMPIGFNAAILNPDKLASVTLLKPIPEKEKSKLMSKYGKEAADGVILITTKKSEIEYASADTSSNKLKNDSTCKDTFVSPQFPGGEAKLLSYVADSIQYPFASKQLKTQGKVFVRFMVDKTGKVSDASVIRRVDYFLDKEALRVVSTLPDWIPGTKCGEQTNSYVIMPVSFKLDDPKAPKIWERNAKTIILLDGVRLPASFNIDWINYANLTTYQTLQPGTKEVNKKLVSQYGKDAVNGVILIGSRK